MEDTGLKVVEDRSEDDTEVPLDTSSTLKQILGKVRSDADVTEDEPQGNSTRWIFDLGHVAAGQVRVQLAFKYPRQGKGALLRSYSLSPLSRGFHEAKVYIEEEVDEEGNETIVFHAAAACTYRVAIDTIHSSTR
jgi:hypothetical protein